MHQKWVVGTQTEQKDPKLFSNKRKTILRQEFTANGLDQIYWTRSIRSRRCFQCWSMTLANDFHHKYLICMSGGRVETRNWANMLGQWVSKMAKQSQKTKLQKLIKTAGCTAWLSISHISEIKIMNMQTSRFANHCDGALLFFTKIQTSSKWPMKSYTVLFTLPGMTSFYTCNKK